MILVENTTFVISCIYQDGNSALKIWKKIFFILLAVILTVQIPFIYNRYKFGVLSDQINGLGANRVLRNNHAYNDFKGIIHAHTFLGGHSTGLFNELIDAAAANELDFVIMTEHPSSLYDSSALTLNGIYKNVLFVGGNEVAAIGSRFLQLPGDADANDVHTMRNGDYLNRVHERHEIAFWAYPENCQTPDADFDGMEILNLGSNTKKINPFPGFFDGIWSFSSYPDLVMTEYLMRPDDNLRKFDRLSKDKKLTLIAGADAHSNIGLLIGDDTGHKFVNLQIDPYENVFKILRNHILLEKDKELNKENLLQALKSGHSFIGLDTLGDAAGFEFTAENGRENKIMGDEINLREAVDLKIAVPLSARIVIFKNGENVFQADNATETNLQVKERGTYRAEIYLDSLGKPFDAMPWIISNPIYIR